MHRGGLKELDPNILEINIDNLQGQQQQLRMSSRLGGALRDDGLRVHVGLQHELHVLVEAVVASLMMRSDLAS